MSKSTGNQDSMRNIGQDRIRSICIPMCCPDEMKIIMKNADEQISRVEVQLHEIDCSIIKSSALRQLILKKAFSCQLVPQDPTDEPASLLLERMKAEKEKLDKVAPKKKKTARRKNSA